MQCLCVHTYFSNNIKLGYICYICKNWAVDNNIKQNTQHRKNHDCITILLNCMGCFYMQAVTLMYVKYKDQLEDAHAYVCILYVGLLTSSSDFMSCTYIYNIIDVMCKTVHVYTRG